MLVSALSSGAIPSARATFVAVAGSTRTRGISPQKVKLVIPSPKKALSGRPPSDVPSL